MTSRLEGGQEYMARADSWDLSENRKGNVELVVNFKVVVEPEERDEAGKITKKAQYEWLNFQRLYFTELSWKRSVQSLIYMGWTGDDLSELRDNGGGLDANEVSITTELSPEYVDEKGNRRPPEIRVKWINKPGVRLASAMSEDKAKAWGAKMIDLVRQMRSEVKSGAKAGEANGFASKTKGAASPDKDDSDLPF